MHTKDIRTYHTQSWATTETARIVQHKTYIAKNYAPADSIGIVSVSYMQLAPKVSILCEITRNDGHCAIQGHSRSPIVVPIESQYATSYQSCIISELLWHIGQIIAFDWGTSI